MIHTDIHHAVAPILETMAAQNLQVFAKANSPVGLLASLLSKPGVDVGVDPLVGVIPLSYIDGDALEQCEAMFDQMATDIAAKLVDHLNFARNQVAPLVTSFAEAVIPDVGIATHNEAYDLEIVPQTIPALAMNGSLQVENFEVDADRGLLRLEHTEPRSDEEVTELMLVGKAAVDADIHTFVASLPRGALSHIWDTFFSGRRTTDIDSGMGSGALFNEPLHGLNRSLVVFLVASKLVAAPQSDCNAPPEVYSDIALQLRNQAGTLLRRHAANYESDIEDGLLIVGVNYPKIYVNAEVYQKFLKEGGSNEMILGRWLTGETSILASGLLEKGAQLESAWTAHTSAIRMESDNRRHVATISVFRNSFPEFLARLDDDIAPINTRERAVARFEEKLGSKTPRETVSVYELALETITYALFDHTDAYKILSGVSRAHAVNTSLTPAECASISTSEYLGGWGASMLTVVKGPQAL